MIKETHKRTIARMISYRIIALITTIPITYWLTGSISQALGSAMLIHVILSVEYYFHERFWLKMHWGLSYEGIDKNKHIFVDLSHENKQLPKKEEAMLLRPLHKR